MIKFSQYINEDFQPWSNRFQNKGAIFDVSAKVTETNVISIEFIRVNDEPPHWSSLMYDIVIGFEKHIKRYPPKGDWKIGFQCKNDDNRKKIKEFHWASERLCRKLHMKEQKTTTPEYITWLLYPAKRQGSTAELLFALNVGNLFR